MQENEIKLKIIKGTEEKEEETAFSSKKKFSIKQFFVKPQKEQKEKPLNIEPPSALKTYELKEKIEIAKESDLTKEKTAPVAKKQTKKITLSIKKILFGILLIFIVGSLGYLGFKYKFLLIDLLRKKDRKSEISKPTSTTSVEPIIKPKIVTSTEITTLESTSTISLSSATSVLSTTSTSSGLTSTFSEVTSTETTTKTTSSEKLVIATPNISTKSIATSSIQTQLTTSVATTSLQKTIISEEKKLEPPSPKSEEIKSVKKEEIPPQKSSELKELGVFPEITISLKELNYEGIKRAWLELLKIQKEAGSLYEIKFLYEGKKVSNDLIVNYFINPTFIEKQHSQNFKENLIDYKILFYYTYTRKYPILIFKINNESFVITFLRLWDKETLLKDMYNLYLGLPKGKLLRNYTITETFEGIKYNIAYYDNDYKFIWTLDNNYLIFSTSLNAFKYLIKKLK